MRICIRSKRDDEEAFQSLEASIRESAKFNYSEEIGEMTYNFLTLQDSMLLKKLKDEMKKVPSLKLLPCCLQSLETISSNSQSFDPVAYKTDNFFQQFCKLNFYEESDFEDYKQGDNAFENTSQLIFALRNFEKPSNHVEENGRLFSGENQKKEPQPAKIEQFNKNRSRKPNKELTHKDSQGTRMELKRQESLVHYTLARSTNGPAYKPKNTPYGESETSTSRQQGSSKKFHKKQEDDLAYQKKDPFYR